MNALGGHEGGQTLAEEVDEGLRAEPVANLAFERAPRDHGPEEGLFGRSGLFIRRRVCLKVCETSQLRAEVALARRWPSPRSTSSQRECSPSWSVSALVRTPVYNTSAQAIEESFRPYRSCECLPGRPPSQAVRPTGSRGRLQEYALDWSPNLFLPLERDRTFHREGAQNQAVTSGVAGGEAPNELDVVGVVAWTDVENDALADGSAERSFERFEK